jgi:hypothetical protein
MLPGAAIMGSALSGVLGGPEDSGVGGQLSPSAVTAAGGATATAGVCVLLSSDGATSALLAFILASIIRWSSNNSRCNSSAVWERQLERQQR